jgi:ABC-2 type transport system permease protein
MPDALIMTARCFRLTTRQLDALLTSLLLPVLLMLLFVCLFGGAIHTGTRYVTYVVPGVLLLCAGYGAAVTGVSVSQDMASGIIDRFRSLDVSGAAILGGHIAASIARNAASTFLVFGVACLIGFRPHAGPAGFLAVCGLLLMYVLAMSWLAAAFGLAVSSPEAANAFTFGVAFLPYASGAFVPIATMPAWIHGFARNQPVTPATEAIRGLLLGTPVGAWPWIALAWCGSILAAGVVISGVLFGRRTT